MSVELYEMPASRLVTLCPPDMWRSGGTTPFHCRRDMRGLLSIQHPWAPGRRGHFGEWSCMASPPKDWKPGRPLFVSFYQSDNYCGSWQQNDWMGAQAFVGHRFKQLLVNGEVVWEQDVADDELAGGHDASDALSSLYHCQPRQAAYRDAYRVVDISHCGAPRMTLTLRVRDKVASGVRLPEDHYQRFSWSSHNPKKAAMNFQTSVYFGDIALVLKKEILRPVAIPPPSPTRRSRRSMPAKATAWLRLTSADMPKPGFPVRSGIPLPPGMFRDTDSIILQTARQERVPCAFRSLSRWQDGSIRALLCEFIGQAGRRYRVISAPASPDIPSMTIHRSRGGISADNGLISLALGASGQQQILRKLESKDGPSCPGMSLTMKLNRVGLTEIFVSVVRSAVVESSNSQVAVFRVEGDMVSETGGRFGPFRARFELWAGLPHLLGNWRVINESDQAMALFLDWSARLRLPNLEDAIVDFGPCRPGHDKDDPVAKAMAHVGTVQNPRRLPLPKGGELSCRQERANCAQILRDIAWVATADKAAGFVNVTHPSGGITAAMRWFAEEFPKGLVLRPDTLSLSTLPEATGAQGWKHDRPQARLGRGEAKTQAFALWLHSGRLPSREAERFNACVQDAPRLFNQAWFIQSGALEAGPQRALPALTRWRKYATPSIEETGIHIARLGHREYWDTAWMNNYRDRLHQGLMQFVETADRRWLRYFEACASHHKDVDRIHYCPEHPEWVGNYHCYGADHTSAGPMGNIGLNVDGLLEHHLITGDPESLEAARGVAEHLLGCDARARSARAVGWPLAQVTRWYEQSGDLRFLKKAREFVAAAHAYVEPRRGIFTEMHGTYSYRGAVPFMTGYLAFGLIRYHRLTSDAGALRLLQWLAAGLLAEARRSEGGFFYSPFPENNALPNDAAYFYSNTLVGGLTGYLWFATGDPFYARQTLECHPSVRQFQKGSLVKMDMLPTACWMLRVIEKFGSKKAGITKAPQRENQ